MTRLYLDIGRRHGARPQDVVGSFTAEANIPGSAIGTIDLFDDFALVDVERRAARKVLDRAAHLMLHGRAVHVTRARAPRG
jgi:ATP-dependent RNA helicase DeaD